MGKRYYMLACLAGLLFIAMAEPALAAEEAAQGGYLSGYETNVPQPAAMSWWSTAAYLVSLFVIFAFVVGMAYLAARFLGGHFARPMKTTAGRIVTNLPLGPGKSVCIVEMSGHFGNYGFGRNGKASPDGFGCFLFRGYVLSATGFPVGAGTKNTALSSQMTHKDMRQGWGWEI